MRGGLVWVCTILATLVAFGFGAAVEDTKAARSLLQKRNDEFLKMFSEEDENANGETELVRPRQLTTLGLEELNSYLSGQKFGPIPGPCTDKNNDACFGDSKNMPDYIAKIRATLSILWLSFTDNIADVEVPNDPGWVRSGIIQLWSTWFRNPRVDELAITYQGETATSVSFQFNMERLSLELESYYRMYNLIIGLEAFGATWITGDSWTFGDSEDNKVVRINQGPLDANGKAINLRMNMRLSTRNNIPLSQDLPYTLNFVGARVEDQCNFAMELSDSVISFPYGVGYRILGIDLGGALSVIIGLLEGTIAAMICEVIVQSAFLENGDPGALNIFIRELYDDVHQYTAPVPVQTVVVGNETELRNGFVPPGVGPDQKAEAMKFNEDSTYTFLTENLNDILGSISDSDGYRNQNILVINEVVDQLIGDRSGIFDVPDPTNPLENMNIDPSVFSQMVELAPVNIEFKLKSYKIKGLNTFKNNFILMSNGVSASDPAWMQALNASYTLHNQLELEDFGLEFTVDMILTPGEWVTSTHNPPKREVFDFTFGVDLADTTVDAYSELLVNLAELDDVKLGQLFDYPAGQADLAVTCAAQALYHADFTSMTLSVGNFGNPTLINFGSGLEVTITQILAIASKLFVGGFNYHMPAITQNLIRPELNQAIFDYLQTLEPCWDYPIKDNIDIIDLDLNFFIINADKALNKLVGGDPIDTSSTDINTLIDERGEVYKDDIAQFLCDGCLLQRYQRGYWQLFQEGMNEVIGRFQSQTDGQLGSSFIEVAAFQMKNVDSFYRLEFSTINKREERITASIGEGVLADSQPTESFNVIFELGSQVYRDGQTNVPSARLADDYVEFDFNFDFDLDATLYMEIDNNKLMQVTMEQLQKFPMCVLAAFEEYKISNLILNTTRFSYTIKNVKDWNNNNNPDPSQFSNSILGNALSGWYSNLLAANGDPGRRTTAQVRYLLNRAANYLVNVIDDTEAQNRGLTLQNCETYQLQINSTALGFLTLPRDGENVFEDQPYIRTWIGNESYPSADWEDRPIIGPTDRAFDIRKAPIVAALRNNSNSVGLADPIRKLANNSDFAEYLTLNPDDSVDLHIDLTKQIDPFKSDDIIQGLKITLGNLTVNNIQDAQFAFFKEYDEDARFTTAHNVDFNYDLNVTLEFDIETSGEFVGEDPNTVVVEKLRLDFQIDKLKLDIITMVAVDLNVLQELQIDTFVAVDSAQTFSIRADWKQCIMKAFFEKGLYLPGFQVTFDNVKRVLFRARDGGAFKLFTQDGINVMGAALDALVEVYKAEMKDITQTKVRELLNDFLDVELEQSRVGNQCPYPLPPNLSGDDRFFDFRSSKQILNLYAFIEDEVMNPSSGYYINTYVRAALDAGIADIDPIEIKNLPLSYNQDSFGKISIKLYDFELVGLDSFDNLMVMDYRPVENIPEYQDEYLNYTHRTQFGTGAGPTDVVVRFKLSILADDLFENRAGMLPDEDGELVRVQDDLQFEFSFSYVSLSMDLVTKLDIPTMLKVKLEAFIDLVQYPCLLEAFPQGGLQIREFIFGVGNVTATLSCVDQCNSPQLQAIADFNSGGAQSEELNRLITDFADTAIRALNFYIKSDDFANEISEEIDYSTTNCIKLDQPLDTVSIDYYYVAKYMGIVGLGVLFSGMAAMGALVPMHISRRDEVMKRALLLNAAKGKEGSSIEFMLTEQKMRSLFNHPSIQIAIKFGVPLWILINISMFIAANFFSLGASVQLRLGLLGDTTKPLDLMTFTLESSVDDMWNAGTYELAIIIAVASGGWPYIKNFLLMFCWFAPATVLPSKKRGGMVEILDVLGKWSLIDVYVLVMLNVAFRFYITSSYIGGLDSLFPADLLIVDVVVTPGFGLYGFLLGAMGSLFVNHVVIVMHERAAKTDEDLEDKINGVYVAERPTPKVALQKHRFGAADQNGRLYGYGPGTKVSVGALLFISFALVAVGSFIPLMNFTFLGIAGIAINVIDNNLSSVTYSLFTIATAIVEGSSDDAATRLGILFIQIVYLMFALIVPILLIATFATLWYVPLRLREQKRLFLGAKILGAWEALLVFIVSVVAAILQISQLAQFIVLNSTGTICANLEQFLRNRDVSESDSKCFDVQASLEPTGFILIGGAILLTGTSVVMFRLVGAALEDRYAMMKKKECINPRDYPGKGLKQKLLKFTTVPVARLNMNNANNNNQVSAYDGDDDKSSYNPMYSANFSGSASNIDV